ncbi:MAG: aminomethyl-transferring glycine dehydrogenase [Blastococcus sp.]
MSSLNPAGSFAARHIGPRPDDVAEMLAVVGHPTLESLVDSCVPEGVRDRTPLALPAAVDEAAVLAQLRERADANDVYTSMIGLGYYGTITPAVIQRSVLENPAWYTAYTPYQPEISQGRLEALINFQTMVADLTGLPVAGASMLDEATAAAEAMTLVRRAGRAKADAVFVVDADTLPQTLGVLQTRAEPLGIALHVADLSHGWPTDLPEAGAFGVLLSYPGASGAVRDHRALAAAAHEAGASVVVAADLLALTLLEAPGEWGADVACGTSQRFGVPMGYGGPHAGYLSVREGLARQLPGRLVGVSVDADGDVAYRLALQTREQHIRREKATSNICTAQVLLAVMAGAYAVYHGAEGLAAIAARVHRSATVLAGWLRAGGLEITHEHYFDTLTVAVPGRAADVVAAAAERRINLRQVDADTVSVACDETTTVATLRSVAVAFGVESGEADGDGADALPAALRRRTPYLTHPVFSAHRSETAMLRYLRALSDKDLALDRTMIPLGSCTMKLNAATEMAAITWPEFANLHPFAPVEQARGYARLIDELCRDLAEVTGYAAVSVQPNAGSQGEFAGLLAIRGYHRSRGEAERDVCLIPSSAHGTNAASAVMAGMRVVVVACDEAGNVDVADLHAKVDQHAARLAAIMLTYPSTHGVFETEVQEICAAVHDAGGQVYVDGANLNALVGLAKPGRFGSDVSHLNLHKTFCIPHGGGGPGVGPIGVREHLVPFLPNHPLVPAGPETGPGPVSAAPWGSAGILPISWAYVRLMGPDGLLAATEHAILAANYLAARLREHFPVLYTGPDGLVAHECILDIRPLTKATGITNDDIAKRLIDFGFHAPTMSFPVAGTLMVEPTESEDKAELDRFVEAMVTIREEIAKVASGEFDAVDNPLRNAPHTLAMLAGEWDRPYPRTTAVYPVAGLVGRGYLSPVRRIDQAYGDRHLVCSCPPPEAFADHDFTAHEAAGNGSVPARAAGSPDDLGTTPDVVGARA